MTVIKPGVGVNETGFAAFLGDFDSLVDTLHEQLELRISEIFLLGIGTCFSESIHIS